MNENNRNIFVAVLLSLVILLGFEWYSSRNRPPPPPAPPKTAETQASKPSAPPSVPTAPAAPSAAGAPSVPGAGAVAAPVAAAEPRIRIRTPRLHGSLSLAGGRIDELTLANYHEKPEGKGGEIPLLIRKGAKNAYYAQFGWVGEGIKVPGPDTVWTADKSELRPDQPVTLNWDNGEGLAFSLIVTLDADYMFTVAQRVANAGKTPATLYPYGLIARSGTPAVAGFYILHEGPLGVLGGQLKEINYEDLRKKGSEEARNGSGWIGITDKYWLTALVPEKKGETTYRFVHRKDGGDDRYQVDYRQSAVTVAAGGQALATQNFFAGAKELALLDGYEAKYGIPRFDLAIDFGWFYFLTKPIFYALVWLNKHVGNFGIAILILTVGIKLLFFPLANKSYVAMSKMKKLQPEMVKLRERFGDDKARINQELMALYKREKTNPASGCLPVVIQIPVFFALYKVLYVTIEMRHAPFYGWIKDLSAPDPTTLFNLFGLVPWTPPDFLMVGVWPIIMGVTMWFQQLMNPQPADPVQAKVFMFLPLVFTFLLASFPAGLVIYWAWNNVLSVAQQWVIMRRMGVKPT